MNNRKPTLLFGAHMSIAGEPKNAIERGESIGCTAIQIFTKSNRQWRAKPIAPQEAEAFKQAWKKSSIERVIAHCSYLINAGSENSDIVKKSIEGLVDELRRCQTLGISQLVLHPGSLSTQETTQHSLARIAQNIDISLDKAETDVSILLETMAGQGNNSCYTFEQIVQVYEASKNSRHLGVCFDTCHVFAAGYDLTTDQGYHETWRKFDALIGLNNLKAIHLNDSKKPLGSRVDRHEHIGEGKIGLKSFALLMNDKRFFSVPKILETPKTTLAEDAVNLRCLFNTLTPQTKKILNIPDFWRD